MNALKIVAILASSPNGPSGLALTTLDGTRRIVGGADKTVRFYETKNGKPTLPPTSESPEGVYREVAVFRLDDAVTNLQMTGDGTRLIISLADGSARVWDIRDPAERRKDLEREWAERVPAGEYLDGLWNTPIETLPTESIREKIIADASLTPLRRLVAVEMLEERLEDTRVAAEEAFAKIVQQAEKETQAWQAIDTMRMKSFIVTGANDVDLPPRVKEVVFSRAAKWEYTPSGSQSETKLKEETKKKDLAEAAMWFERFLHGDIASPKQQIDVLSNILKLRQQHAAPSDDAVIEAQWALGSVLFAHDVSDTRSLAMMQDAVRMYEANHGEPSASLIALYNNLAGAELSSGQFANAETTGRKLIAAWKSLGTAPTRVAIDAPFTPFSPHYVGSIFMPWESEPDFAKVRTRLDSLQGEGLRGAWIEDLENKLRKKFTLSPLGNEPQSDSEVAWLKVRVLPSLEMNASREATALARAMANYMLANFGAVIDDLKGSTSNPQHAAILAAAQFRSGRVREARESLSQTRSLMQPAADGTPSPWVDDEDAKALLAEADALIGK
ncbi:MAG: hypothetical protein U0640_06835 [Phycisphaerales bacterium]